LATENTARKDEHKELREEISSLSNRFESLSDSIEKTKSLVTYNDSQKQEAIDKFREQIEKLEGELWDISSRVKKLETPATVAPAATPAPAKRGEPPSDPKVVHAAEVKAVTDAFNQWAANPSSSLPHQFYCLKNYMSMRSECELIEASEPTKWIANKTAPLCLFPNPNFFTPHTDISEFYDMDITKLKPRGQNRIRVTVPCEMTEKGCVRDTGKLDLL
jgi:polyhydroxyalkanoate synthesis regulator phasin